MVIPSAPGIYKITSPSGRFYIGSSTNLRKRWYSHCFDLRRGKHHCAALQKAANKYGVDSLSFKPLAVVERNLLREIEQSAIDTYKPAYNSTRCTREPLTGLWKDPDFRRAGQIRASEQVKRLRKDPTFCEKQRNAARAALANTHKDKDFAAAHKKRATARLRDVVNVPEVQARAAETRRLRLAQVMADKDAWSQRFDHVSQKNSEAVLCVETGITFHSHKEAGAWLKKEFGFKTSGHISNCLSGRMKTAYGFTWKRVKASTPTEHVIRCLETGQTFDSIRSAAVWLGREDASKISGCARGKRRSAYGYTWRYEVLANG